MPPLDLTPEDADWLASLNEQVDQAFREQREEQEAWWRHVLSNCDLVDAEGNVVSPPLADLEGLKTDMARDLNRAYFPVDLGLPRARIITIKHELGGLASPQPARPPGWRRFWTLVAVVLGLLGRATRTRP